MPVVTLSKTNSKAFDTFVQSSNPNTSYATLDSAYVGATGGNKYRMMLFFDFGLIPNDAIINSASLNLHQASGTARTLDIHPITAPWQDTDTWNSNIPYDSNKKATVSAGGGAVAITVDVKSIVQDMINGVNNNYGFLIKLADETQSLLGSIDSLDHATAANRPTLTIDYTIPSTGKKCVEYITTSSQIASGGSVTYLDVPIPAQAQAGDLLILQSSGAYAQTFPGDWTVQASGSVGGNSYRYVTTKFMQAGDSTVRITATQMGAIYAKISVFRNVKSVATKNSTTYTSSTSSFFPPATTTSVSRSLFLLINHAGLSSITFTQPLSYSELSDSNGWGLSGRYMYDKTSQTTSEMTSTLSSSSTGLSAVLVLEPIANNPPTLTLTSPTDNQTLVEGNTYQIAGSVTDADSGDVVTVKYKIDNGTTYNITAAVSDGSTPLNFSKTLTYLNSRLYDGQTPVTPILDDQVPHTLTVWAEDDKGGKSADAVRNFTVLYNQPPQISGSDQDIGSIATPPSIQYSVTDAEHYSFTITEKVGDVTIRSFPGTDGQQETLTIPNDIWITLQPDVTHNLTITATDQYGASSTRTYTFKRTVDGIELETRTPLPADAQPYRMVLTLNAQYPQNAVVNVQVCNNGYDENPTWEDATSAVLNKRPYVFTNTSKTAENWGIKIKISILPGA